MSDRLREFFDHEASRVHLDSAYDEGMGRRVRVRMGVTMLTCLALVGGLIVGGVSTVRALRLGGRGMASTTAATPGPAVTREASGVTVTYPSQWSLIELGGRLNGAAGTMDGVRTVWPVLQLTNFFPGLDQPQCADGSSKLPAGGVLLYMQRDVSYDAVIAAGTASWPVALERRVVADTPCGPGWHSMWRVGDAIFEATAVTNRGAKVSDIDRLLRAYEHLTFPAIDVQTELHGDPGRGSLASLRDRPRLVVASGSTLDQDWTLTVASDPDGVVLGSQRKAVLAVELGGSIGTIAPEGHRLKLVSYSLDGLSSPRILLVGVVSSAATSVQLRLSAYQGQAGILLLPRALGLDFNALIADVPGPSDGEAVALDSNGRILERMTLSSDIRTIPPPPSRP